LAFQLVILRAANQVMPEERSKAYSPIKKRRQQFESLQVK
jgi:hypothetical protein